MMILIKIKKYRCEEDWAVDKNIFKIVIHSEVQI